MFKLVYVMVTDTGTFPGMYKFDTKKALQVADRFLRATLEDQGIVYMSKVVYDEADYD